MIVLISRLIKQILGKYHKSVIGHTNKDKFIIVREKHIGGQKIVNEIKSEFEKLIPFIYHDKDPKNIKKKIELDFKIIKSMSVPEMFSLIK